MQTVTLQTLKETDSLRITYIPGQTNQCILCFTGLKHKLGGINEEEFIGTCHRSKCHVLFISDLSRSWYNTGNIIEEIINIVTQYKKEHCLEQIFTLGNSMGGYGALLFGSLLEARHTIALDPQYSIHPDIVPGELRPWLQELQYRYQSAQEFLDTRSCHTIIQGLGPDDIGHTKLFAQNHKNIKHILLPAANHNSASILQNKGILNQYIQEILSNQHKNADQLILNTNLGAYIRQPS